MSSFWSWYVILIVAINIIGCAWLLFFMRKNPRKDIGENESLGYDFDGIKELNNPLPNWWMWIFWLSLIFAIFYLVLYPGLGNVKGFFGWSSQEEWRQDVAEEAAKYQPLYEKYYKQPIAMLAKNKEAMETGQRLFQNNCATCHGSDGRGGKGFPDLTDNVWLYGGKPETIETTILHGRIAAMPPMGEILGSEAVIEQVAAYVKSLNGYKMDQQLVSAGKMKFQEICAVCHGQNGKGNPILGAPNLTNDTWLYGGSTKTIKETIIKGRNGQMPAQQNLLSKEKIRVLAAYVYSLSQD